MASAAALHLAPSGPSRRLVRLAITSPTYLGRVSPASHSTHLISGARGNSQVLELPSATCTTSHHHHHQLRGYPWRVTTTSTTWTTCRRGESRAMGPSSPRHLRATSPASPSSLLTTCSSAGNMVQMH